MPDPLQGASKRIVSKRKNSSKFRESFTKTVTRLAPNLFRLYFKRSARILSNSQAVMQALLLVRAANWVVLLIGQTGLY